MKFDIKKSVSRKLVKFSNEDEQREPIDHESKSANKLFSIKSTINMKRVPVNNVNALNGNKNKILKNIVSVGVSFSNIFKPGKRMNKMDGNGDHQNIIIDPDVYLPPEYKSNQNQCSVRISIQSMNNYKTPEQFEQKTRVEKVMLAKNSETPKMAFAKSTCDLISVSKLVKQYSLEMQSRQDSANDFVSGSGTIRKTQPSMGVRAYSIKSRKAFFENLSEKSLEARNERSSAAVAPVNLTPFLDLSKRRPSISILSSTSNNLICNQFPVHSDFDQDIVKIKTITPQKAFHLC